MPLDLRASNTKLTAQLDRALAEDRELDERQAAKALEAAMNDAVRRYLNRVVPTAEKVG